MIFHTVTQPKRATWLGEQGTYRELRITSKRHGKRIFVRKIDDEDMTTFEYMDGDGRKPESFRRRSLGQLRGDYVNHPDIERIALKML